MCSARTNHTEAVLVVFDPAETSYEALLKLFWENHDPTQGMRQGNDVGTQYRSAIYATTPEQLEAAEASRETFQKQLGDSGYGEITTEIAEAGPFYYAEAYHQQYLAKNPNGYCGLGGTGVSCPIGTGVTGRLSGGTSSPAAEHSTSWARRRSRVASRLALVTQCTAARR